MAAGNPAETGKAKSDALAKEDRKHLKRMANINRIHQLGQDNDNQNLVQKAEMLREKEQKRHQKKLQTLQKSPAANGDTGPGKEKAKGNGDDDGDNGDDDQNEEPKL